ncbi:MAG TPA: Sjogren's syndrome/scleroderma autoantigen 1 family protein [Methanosarcina sp.]|nr:Sjogren's syndrome/scleroderma autoantigen 1 family protein [Methanosarcina sp.]
MDSEKDQKVKRIARFLELGGTMLAEHCKVCGAPKFRYQGTVICPICDVREEEDTPKPAAKVQVPEVKQYTEKEKPSFENKKRVQAYRQKPRLGSRGSESIDEREKNPDFAKENFSRIPSEIGETKRVASTPSVQVPPPGKAEKQIDSSKPSEIQKVRDQEAVYEEKAHRNREILENLLFKKMTSIASSIQDEKDPRSVFEKFELIEKGIELIERLKRI